MLAFHVKVAEEVDGALRLSVTLTVRVIPPPVTVMTAWLLPRLAVDVFTLAVIVELFEPEVGLTVSHDALPLAVHVPLETTITD